MDAFSAKFRVFLNLLGFNMEVVEKLAVNENVLRIPDEFMRIASEGLLKFGKLSVPYLMRKLKCTESMAYNIICEICPTTSDNKA